MQNAGKDDQHLQALRLAALIQKGKEKLVQWDERILCSALKLSTDAIVVLPMPGRHHHITVALARSLMPGERYHDAEQGFFTSLGRFVGREMAMQIARRADQVISDTKNSRLFSEDLW